MHKPRSPSHATIVAYLALFFALSGSAVAASGVLIKKSSQVGKGVITSKALKDHAAVNVNDLTPRALASLKTAGATGAPGAAGAKGDPGPAGARGAKGADGKDGLSDGPAGGALTGNYPNPGLKQPEAVRVVGSANNPPFLTAEEAKPFNGVCGGPAIWSNVGGDHQVAGFYRDPLGLVHVVGTIKSGSFGCAAFQLPAGYRPAARQPFAQMAGGDRIERVDVLGNTSNGGSGVVLPLGGEGTNGYLSLAGITFQCAPSGQDGCP